MSGNGQDRNYLKQILFYLKALTGLGSSNIGGGSGGNTVNVNVSDAVSHDILSAALQRANVKVGTEVGTITNGSANTVVLSGAYPSIVNNASLVYLKVDTGTEVYFLITGVNGVYLSYSAGTITVTGSSAVLTATDEYELGIVVPKYALDYDLNAELDIVQNPEWAHYTSTEQVVSATNVAAATYRTIIDVEGYRNGALQLKGSGGVTFTIWASLDDTADDTADTGWIDVSTLIIGAANLVDSEDIFFIDTNIMPDRFMIKYVTSVATNAIDVWFKKY